MSSTNPPSSPAGWVWFHLPRSRSTLSPNVAGKKILTQHVFEQSIIDATLALDKS